MHKCGPDTGSETRLRKIFNRQIHTATNYLTCPNFGQQYSVYYNKIAPTRLFKYLKDDEKFKSSAYIKGDGLDFLVRK